MAAAIIQRWPHLREGLSYIDGTSLWKHRLRSSFKNLRRRSSALINIHVVLGMKAKYGKRKNQEIGEIVEKSKKDVWGVANFLPERLPGEDDTTISQHVAKLKQQKELTVGRRNNEIINLAMKNTFPERRNALLIQLMKLSDILDMYPLLTEGDQVSLLFFVNFSSII